MLYLYQTLVSDANDSSLSMCAYEPEAPESVGATRLIRATQSYSTGRTRAGSLSTFFRLRSRLNPLYLEKRSLLSYDRRQLILCGTHVRVFLTSVKRVCFRGQVANFELLHYTRIMYRTTYTRLYSGGLDGGLSALLPLEEVRYQRLLMLQHALATNLQHRGGLNHSMSRYVATLPMHNILVLSIALLRILDLADGNSSMHEQSN